MDISTPKLVYSRNQLLALRTISSAGVVPHLPEELRWLYCGCRAGAELKAKRLARKWRYKPAVSPVIMANVNILPNKIDSGC